MAETNGIYISKYGNSLFEFARSRVEAPLLDYLQSILAELCSHWIRAQLDASNDHIKIANAEQMKVHTMLVVGNRDLEANAVSVRVHGKGNRGETAE